VERLNWVDAILDHPIVYRLWQAPFANKKLEPVFRHNDITKVRKVLDVGCGPGTNAGHFMDSDYLGIDFNERYIENARKRYKREFVVADVTAYSSEHRDFDFILVNSILHHIDEPAVVRILSHLESLLSDDGNIHILELVQPAQRGIADLLQRWDRGAYARPEADWQRIFSSIFETLVFEPYELKGMGATLWNMIYFKGRAK
jgi:ubiquinone/menaquinone biosynthesis C-methylase UbiE